MHLREAILPDDVPMVRDHFREYSAELGVDLCFQGFEAELASLPGAYAPPRGRILLAEDAGEIAGVVALRPLGEHDGEMKRLYVRPAFRARGAGRLLVERLLHEGRHVGYRRICLDTLPVMARAIELYRALGFVEIEPYCHNPICGAMYFAKTLSPHPGT